MIALRSDLKVVLAAQPIDFRKSVHGRVVGQEKHAGLRYVGNWINRGPLSHGVMSRPTRSEPIAVLGERRIPLPLQNLL